MRTKVSVQRLHPRGGRIAPLSFRELTILPYRHHDASGQFPDLPTSVLAASGKARKGSGHKRTAVLFSGGPASGGHDVLCGIGDTLRGRHTLLGVHGGPGGLLKEDLAPLRTDGLRGTGGFWALGTDRTKLKPHIEEVRAIVKAHRIDALIIIGGDDSSTNAAHLAQHLKGTQVIVVPKTMDCDLQAPPWLTCTFGFDTACRTYAQLVGNLLADTRSTRKYWHFVRLMGRDASHVTLEVALETRPTLALISEEESWHRRTLSDVVEHIVHVVRARVRDGRDHGVILVPEGLLEQLPDMREMIAALNTVWARHRPAMDRRNLARRRAFLARQLNRRDRERFLALPVRFQELLSLNRDAHGNVKLSQLPTEELLIDLVRSRIEEDLPGYSFKAERHFYGYEGRCGTPTAFDQHLSYSLGVIAGSLVLDGRTGYLAALGGDLRKGGTPYAVPLAPLLEPEMRGGKPELVVRKRLVRHDDPAFQTFARQRISRVDADARSPGPHQADTIEVPLCVLLNAGGGRP